MYAIETPDVQFNQAYHSLSTRLTTYKELLSFCVNNNYITQERNEELNEEYKNAMINVIMSDYTFDEEEDASSDIKKMIVELSNALDDYLLELNNPYEAVKFLLESDPKKVIKFTKQRYQDVKKELKFELEKLTNESKIVWTNSVSFKNMVECLGRRIEYADEPAPVYFLMSERVIGHINSLDELREIIKELRIEVSILNHFDRNSIIRLCHSFRTIDAWKNITTVALYNYIFNYLYKGIISIDYTYNMNCLILTEIKEGRITEADYQEAIINPQIGFTEDEINYIDEYFRKTFVDEVVVRRQCGTAVITRKKNK